MNGLILKFGNKIEPIGILMGHLFFENWFVYMGPNSKFQQHVPTKIKLEYPH